MHHSNESKCSLSLGRGGKNWLELGFKSDTSSMVDPTMTKAKRSLCIYKQHLANFIVFCTIKTFQSIMRELF